MKVVQTLRRSLIMCLVPAACVFGQSDGGPVAVGQIKTVRDLVKFRQELDETVWSPEVEAQVHENTFVNLWDNLIHQQDKFAVLRNFEFGEIVLPISDETRRLDHGIVSHIAAVSQQNGGATKTATQSEFAALLNKFESEGYRIIETEWHHSSFEPATEAAPARSTVSILIHATQDSTQTRMVVRGDLKIVWNAKSNGRFKVPASIDASGLRMLSRQGRPAFETAKVEKYAVDPAGKTAATTIHPVLVRDLDNDGLPEVIVAGFNEVHWNRGDWQFEKKPLCDFPVRHPNAAVMADFDGDAIDDLVVGGKNDFVYCFKGEKNGKFPHVGQPIQSIGRLRVPVAVTAGDIDGDGDLDLYVGQQKPGYTNGDIPTPYYDATDSFPGYILLNDGRGNFRDITSVSGLGRKAFRRNFSATFADLDDDRDLDLLLTSDFSGTDYLVNDGSGVFTDVTETMRPLGHAFGMSHSFGDYNLDGRLDFITIGMSSTTARRLEKLNLGRDEFPEYNEARMKMGYGNRLFLRDDIGFSQAPFNETCARTGWAWGSTTLDFDLDGDQDIYIVNGQTSGKTTKDYCTRFWCHDVYYKRGERPDKAIQDLFAGMAPLFSGHSISWNGYEHNALLMNVSGTEFVNVGFLMDCAFEFDSRSTASADLDRDGDIDLIVEQNDARTRHNNLHFVRNNWETKHHWTGVRLQGRPGVSPQGAKVYVTTGAGRKLLQHCLSGHSVWAQHPDTVHFGLGEETEIAHIEVLWPGGKSTRLVRPASDQYHVVVPEDPQ